MHKNKELLIVPKFDMAHSLNVFTYTNRRTAERNESLTTLYTFIWRDCVRLHSSDKISLTVGIVILYVIYCLLVMSYIVEILFGCLYYERRC